MSAAKKQAWVLAVARTKGERVGGGVSRHWLWPRNIERSQETFAGCHRALVLQVCGSLGNQPWKGKPSLPRAAGS